VGILVVIVASGAFLLYRLTTGANADPELMMGILVVVAIATLMTVLFILAAGFSSMSLTDPRQALGLPEGSIRAMIALVLIMVFIIFGIFLFRKVGESSSVYFGTVTTTSDAKIPTDKPAIFTPVADGSGYYVYVLEPINDEGKRLAQQLITTVGTLVVAISSFYFGSTITSAASAKKEREELPSAPTIKDVTPREGAKGKQVNLDIEGTGLNSPRAVRLLRGSEAMVCTDLLSSPTKINCKVLIDKEPGNKWDIVIENADGTTAQLPVIFTITP
jgi:hypothetical protein